MKRETKVNVRIETKEDRKRRIYWELGIVYSNNKVLHPVLGWIPELLIDGNGKIGRGVYHYSTLPTTRTYEAEINGVKFEIRGTCPITCAGCYGTTGNYRFSSTINALAIRTWLAYNDIPYVRACISAQILINDIKYIRIHATGDFFSNEYINMWTNICQCFPDVVFWTYTKNARAEKAADSIPNLNIVKSMIPGRGFNYGHCDYILSLYEELKSAGKSVYICRCGIDKDQHCTNCKGCSKNEHVLFIEHSTDYKAEKDPYYETLKGVIESQPLQ